MNQKILAIILLLSTITTYNLDTEKDFKDKEQSEDGNDWEEIDSYGQPKEHLIPDINCIANDFADFYGFPEREINSEILTKPINNVIDPFIVFLNSILEEKEEGMDNFINISDINTYYKIEEEEFNELRILLDKCAKIPKKFTLNIIELNYLYCAIVWKNGFGHYTQKLKYEEPIENMN